MTGFPGNSTSVTTFAGLNVRVLLAAIVTMVFLSYWVTLHGSKGNYLPAITLTNQYSRTISLSSLRGKPELVGFIHTMCKAVCQMMPANMRSVASALPAANTADVTDAADYDRSGR
jgi:cytochrome oxidase Cu insertion factor (SCO1/SenC/PrrC family)